ncbi:UDP-N-acetylmuramoyl-L-alanyl-D-glutamate--2,6-diaminopimelate ligase [Vibrio sp. SM6]|uniref:UDP-N-acetylmuramoyl-L-alanyl-D-glutamate--2,6-diaminopimelate ligase n=1 Tax=Vibrio agarilyticus TaxID=2726741 RepID=A0A7X8TPL5_9VIBR|nr:UDP-N-acetylmuramoyl-L-alanyl-D-glutamate--2,6-diaminopimelate ligase [Vibrio agarilyticus]NLS12301.1 UDP-N-acetylmuramoyl-L-alanyl-D-glutamate--2,6-diaminopimelate ligase [Vibrio agarilyticus]
MQQTISLSALIAPWLDTDALSAIEVQALTLDSRTIVAGDTFVAICGHAMDGRGFIDSAVTQGANAVIAQADDVVVHGEIHWQGAVPIVYIADLPERLSELAGRLYQPHSEQALSLIGVTGTNGKTTITQLIAQWLDRVGEKAAVMGTTGNGFLANLHPAENTTGNAVDIQRTLGELQAEGARYVALEVSSHGLVQSRVRALPFAAGVFTNLSRDHLDYHQTMDAYAAAKFQLFDAHRCPLPIINADDNVGAEWLKQLPNACAVSLCGEVAGATRSVFATRVDYDEQGMVLAFDGSFGQGLLTVPLIGAFNASNVLLAFATLLSLGFSRDALVACAPELTPVVGRMELFQSAEHAKVVVDYAHTPDALEKALQALRIHCTGQLWVIFGCGGDRDRGKRPMMAAIAEQLADRVILADDNPRGEDPAAIVSDMLAGMSTPEKAVVEHDRFAALKFALEHAKVNDIILLAGKGHEDYQVLKDATVHYSDRDAARQLLGLLA